MKTHKLKILPFFFRELEAGRKTVEFRLDDRAYAVGDKLVLQEHDLKSYTGRELERTVRAVYDVTNIMCLAGEPLKNQWVLLELEEAL